MPVINTTNVQVDLASAGCQNCQRPDCTSDEIANHTFNATRVLPYNDAEVKVDGSPYKDLNSVRDKEFYVISRTNKAYYDGHTAPSFLAPLESDYGNPCMVDYDYSQEYRLATLPYRVSLPACAKVGDVINFASEASEGASGAYRATTPYTLTASDVVNGEAIVDVYIKTFNRVDTLKGYVGASETYIKIETYRVGNNVTAVLNSPTEKVSFWLSDVVIRPSGSNVQVTNNPRRSFVTVDDSIGDNLVLFNNASDSNNQDELNLNDLGLTQVNISHTSKIASFGDGVENGHYKYIFLYRREDSSVDGFNQAVGCTANSHSFHDMRDANNCLILKDWDVTIDISADNVDGLNGRGGLLQLAVNLPLMEDAGIKYTDGAERKTAITCPFDSVDDMEVVEYPTSAGASYTGGNMIMTHGKITSFTVDNDFMRARTKVGTYSVRKTDGTLTPIHGIRDRKYTWANL